MFRTCFGVNAPDSTDVRRRSTSARSPLMPTTSNGSASSASRAASERRENGLRSLPVRQGEFHLLAGRHADVDPQALRDGCGLVADRPARVQQGAAGRQGPVRFLILGPQQDVVGQQVDDFAHRREVGKSGGDAVRGPGDREAAFGEDPSGPGLGPGPEPTLFSSACSDRRVRVRGIASGESLVSASRRSRSASEGFSPVPCHRAGSASPYVQDMEGGIGRLRQRAGVRPRDLPGASPGRVDPSRQQRSATTHRHAMPGSRRRGPAS